MQIVSVIKARCFCGHRGLEMLEVRDWLGYGGSPSTNATYLQ